MPDDGLATVGVAHQEAEAGIRGCTPELAIDEISDPHGADAYAGQWRHEVEYIQHLASAMAREQRQADGHADQPAMEGHAALPDLERIEPVLAQQFHLVAEHIDQHVADATAHDDAHHRPEDEVIHILVR